MDLAKFVWLLKEKRLFMSRLDKFADPYEGSLTKKTIEGIDLFLRQHGSKDSWAEMSNMYRENQSSTFVCCWHGNEQESEAMWRLYCGSGHGIAIQSTYDRLVETIKEQLETYVGCVKYIDYEREWFPDANAFYPVMHKRSAFAHENEVRLVCSPSSYRLMPLEQRPTSICIPWDSTTMIERVYVDPYAPEYFYNVVQSIVSAFEPSISPRLFWSQMKAAPLF
ncbi:hypothetical protein SAMN05216333_102220 [Nitrosomonas oligotropha]|uniref:DUF2971 domain-containing protein n=2 Tax=Nitrosomonas oligotropha TaxID=42354 RepID=A0A1H8KRQ9_9PROT|nr:hypothetical protein SAMN05216300_12720 [Nitrosomonas oligotropha]SEN95577.1 hypothetical protein SAMN05216333_102220 [Nitrosomonas oligotropha]